jgi:hypothetical protein
MVLANPGDPSNPALASLNLPGMSSRGSAAAAGASTAGGISNPMFDFSSAFSGSSMNSRIVDWRRSGSDAADEARRGGIPMLVFFSNHATPTSALLESMFNTTPDAVSIGKNFIPVYIDYADQDTRDSPYYRSLQNHFKPRGFPVLLVALPDGTEVIRQTGYAAEPKMEAEWRKRTLQFLSAAPEKVEKAAAARRKRLESQGYRTWTNNEGKPVFAKLDQLDANQATFISEWGWSFRTFTNRLSDSDRAAIEAHNPRRS